MSEELKQFLADQGIRTADDLRQELSKMRVNIAVFVEEIK